MAVLATRADAAIEIEGTDCIATSYPTFWDDRQRMTVNE
jgi:5-enolpyruvylshikimate-3-phosphate synthase